MKNNLYRILAAFFLALMLSCGNSDSSKEELTFDNLQLGNTSAPDTAQRYFSQSSQEPESIAQEPEASVQQSASSTSGSDEPFDIWYYITISAIALLLGPGVIVFLFYIQLKLWVDAKFHDVHVSWKQLFMMRWRGVNLREVISTIIEAKSAGLELESEDLAQVVLAKIPINAIVGPLIVAHNAGIQVTFDQIKAHHLAKGKPSRVMDALVAARNADKELDAESRMNLHWSTAANIDLAGRDIYQEVMNSTRHEVILSDEMTAFARDGIELTLKARVTVRPKLQNLIQGAGKETLLARIAEGIVTQIGLTASHHAILENPYKLANSVEEQKQLFRDTSYAVESIDIINIKIGRDVLAELESERARSKKLTEQAKEQEMKVKVQEARAKVIEAEIEVQKAMASAFLDGNFSIDDYKKMKNMDADTLMREALSLNTQQDTDDAAEDDD